jgi:dipeptidyl aminopeptidase/acylaminoacyl peptidase
MRFPRFLLITLTTLLPLPALAQGPSADWRTVSTPHFRVHYTAPSEDWARRAAARLESIRERVVEEVGYAPPEVVDVLVSDPVADANGMAFPFLGWPRMVLWTSPPGPESVIGHYSDWSELLVVHEETHLVHLLRPSRNPLRRTLARVAPVGPIALAPRWVSEGYATVVEGRLTGSGRPNGDLRAAILRRWAQGGKLPSYGRLAGDDSWQGMSMAYLVGSAYLEWLEEKAGPGSLKNLWARMTARTARSFDDAFEGVFGDSPADLYDRFRAEVTWRALEAERLLEPAKREGPLWQDLSWNVGTPVVSPDGERLAVVLGSRDEPAELAVFSTAPDEEAEKEWEERREEVRKRDPEDVPAVRTAPVARKRLHTLRTRGGNEPTMPRWMPDGKSLLFVRFEPDPQGFLHPDLFSWTPETDEVRRITREADLRDPDPAPDGSWAVAVRNRHGLSQIVRVELPTGAVTELTAPTVSEVYDQPRLSPDGTRAAFALHREGAWRIAILDIAGGTATELAPPLGGTVSSPTWSPDGRALYAVVGLRGFIDLWSFPLDPVGAPVPVTRTQGAAIAPAPAPDGSGLYYLSLEPDGLDLRRLPLPVAETAAAPPPADIPTTLTPVVRPPAPPAPEPFPEGEVSESRPYGLGRQELFPLLGGSAASDGGAWELGLHGGDVVGRLDWFALGSLGSSGWPTGGALAGTLRRWPVALGFHLFQSEERPSEGFNVPERGNLLDLDRQGVELSARWDRIWSGDRLRLTGAVLWNEVELERGPFTERLDQRIASLEGGWGSLRQWGPWRLQPGLTAHYEAGSTDGDGWSRFGGAAWLGIGHDDTRLRLTWSRDGSDDLARARSFDLYQLGGARTTLLPDTALSGRIDVPALPPGTLLGEEHEGQRAELTLGFLPAPLFYERHRLWNARQAKGDWLTLAGLEYRFAIDPLPIGRLPGLDLRVGVARVLDEPFAEELLEGDTRWWLITVWRP